MIQRDLNRVLFFTVILLLASGALRAQLVLGQYEDEAPVRTWNVFGLAGASSLAMGETILAVPQDATAALGNPALLSRLPKLTLTVSGGVGTASFFKYAMVNTGVVYSQDNIDLKLFGLDFAGLSFRIKGWTFGLAAALTEAYDRPEVNITETYLNTPAYNFRFNQTGETRVFNISVAGRVFGRLQAGLGFNVLSGKISREMRESDLLSGITIIDELSSEHSGFFVNAGLLYEATDRLLLAAAVRTPFTRNADSRSLIAYSVPSTSTDIRTEAAAADSSKQPLILGAGASYAFSDNLRAGLELTRFFWSRYEVVSFGEELARDFRDAWKAGAGVEYTGAFEAGGQTFSFPLRAGIVYDQQPMKDPDSRYFSFTFGTGLQWKGLRLDIGSQVGKESGSGRDLSVRRFLATAGFSL